MPQDPDNGPLDQRRRAALLPALGASGWHAVPGRDAIRKVLKFKSFSQAWAFMSRAALLAEKLNHHPEWCNVYGRVEIILTTHDLGGLGPLDIEFASRIDRFAQGAEVELALDQPIEGLLSR